MFLSVVITLKYQAKLDISTGTHLIQFWHIPGTGSCFTTVDEWWVPIEENFYWHVFMPFLTPAEF